MSRVNLAERTKTRTTSQASGGSEEIPRGFVSVPCSYEHCHISGKNLAPVQILVPSDLYNLIQKAREQAGGRVHDPNLSSRYYEGEFNGIEYRFYVSKTWDIFEKRDCSIMSGNDD